MGTARRMMGAMEGAELGSGLSDDEMEDGGQRAPIDFTDWEDKMKTFDVGSAVEVNI